MKKPIVQVIGATGLDLVPGWGPALTRITITDNEGGDADEIEMEFSVSRPLPPPPPEGTRYRVFYGWETGALRDAGLFSSQKPRISFAPDSGWILTISARSADFVDADKEADSEHFDDMTAGAIFKKLAGAAGKSAIVHPSIANVKIPYRLRWQQSRAGFAQDLADELCGALKMANGQWLIRSKGSGETAAGTAMPPIIISSTEVENCDIEADDKPKFKEIDASWFDAESGLQKLAKAAGIGSAATVLSMHQAASQVQAEAKAKAEAMELARMSVTGSASLEGRIEAMAGAPVVLSDFDSWGGYDLTASSIEHEFTFDDSGGWLMTVQIAKQKGS